MTEAKSMSSPQEINILDGNLDSIKLAIESGIPKSRYQTPSVLNELIEKNYLEILIFLLDDMSPESKRKMRRGLSLTASEFHRPEIASYLEIF